jgi:hypothetical protein
MRWLPPYYIILFAVLFAGMAIGYLLKTCPC